MQHPFAPPAARWARRLAIAALAAAALLASQLAVQTKTAGAADSTALPTSCDVVELATEFYCDYTDTPGAPPCDVDEDPTQPGSRVCTPGPSETFAFQAVDRSNLATGDNRCGVTLKAGYPEDQADPANRPKVGYRTIVDCQQQLRVKDWTATLYKATGEYVHSTGQYWCHSTCPIDSTLRGDVHVPKNSALILRVRARLVLWGGPDPWVATDPRAKPAGGPTSCTPEGPDDYEIDCIMELPFTTPDQQPDIMPRIRPPR